MMVVQPSLYAVDTDEDSPSSPSFPRLSTLPQIILETRNLYSCLRAEFSSESSSLLSSLLAIIAVVPTEKSLFLLFFPLSFLLCDDYHLYHSRINHVARIIFLFLSKLGIESIEKRKKWRCFQLFHSKQLAKSWAQLESYSRDNLLLRSPRGTRDEERAPSLYKTSV